MNLSRAWQRILKAREPDLVMLAMVNPYGVDPSISPSEFGVSPGTIRLATEPSNIVADGLTLPFAPYLLRWPVIEERYAPQDRRFEISEATLEIGAGSGLASALRQAGGGQLATCIVALWSPRLPLSEAIVRLAGPVRGVPNAPELSGPVAITVTDGDADRVVEFPPGPLTRAEFPELPDHVAGVAERQWVSGGYPYQIPCWQIDEEGLIFYVHDGAYSSPPKKFWSYGTSLDRAPRVEVAAMAASGLPYTRLVFDDKPTTPSGLTPVVSCSGGRGVDTLNPIALLLQSIGGYRLSPRALQAIGQSGFAFDALNNVRGDVRRYVADQLIPQTDLVLTFRHGLVDILRLGGHQPELSLGIGTGLQYRHAQQESETPLASVYNAFEIRCGRTASTRGGSLFTIRRDLDHGSDQIRSLLGRSQRAYGRRAITWDALDLATDGVSCPSAEILGDVLARQHAFPWVPHSYRASWLEGLAVDVAQGARLTDVGEGLDAESVVIAARSVLPTGVDLTFAAQAMPAQTSVTRRKVYAHG